MKQLDITINNYQKMIETINQNDITSQKEIAEKINRSPTTVSTYLRRANRYGKIFYKEKRKYITIVSKAEELEYIIKMKKLVERIIKNPEVLLWQYKYAKKEYDATLTEWEEACAYSIEYLREKGFLNNT